MKYWTAARRETGSKRQGWVIFNPWPAISCKEVLVGLFLLGQELQNIKVGLVGDCSMRKGGDQAHLGARCP